MQNSLPIVLDDEGKHGIKRGGIFKLFEVENHILIF